MGFILPGHDAETWAAIKTIQAARRAVTARGLEVLVQTPQQGLLLHIRKPLQPDDEFTFSGGHVIVTRAGKEIGVVNYQGISPRQLREQAEALVKSGGLTQETADVLMTGMQMARVNPQKVPQAAPTVSTNQFRAWAFYDAQGAQVGSLTLDYAGGVGALLIEERNSHGRVVSKEIYDLRAPKGRLGRQAMYELAQLVQGEGMKDSPYLRPAERTKLGDMRAAASLREVLELIEMFGMRSDYHREQSSSVEALRGVWQAMLAGVRTKKPTVLHGNVRGHDVPLEIETSAAPSYLPNEHTLAFVGTVRYAVPGVGRREHHGGFYLTLPKSRDALVLTTADNHGIASDVAVR